MPECSRSSSPNAIKLRDFIHIDDDATYSNALIGNFSRHFFFVADAFDNRQMRDDKCLPSFEKTLTNLRNTRFKFFKVNFDDLMASCSLLYFKFFLKQMKLLILTIKWPPTHTYYCIFTQSFFSKNL